MTTFIFAENEDCYKSATYKPPRGTKEFILYMINYGLFDLFEVFCSLKPRFSSFCGKDLERIRL